MEFFSELTALWLILLWLAAFGAGFMDAIAGGGGMLTLPLLLHSGLDPVVALGTNKLQAVWGTGLAAYRYRRAGLFSLRKMTVAVLATAVGAWLGASFASHLSAQSLTRLAQVFLALVWLYLWRRPHFGQHVVATELPFLGKQLGLGLILGAYDGFLGPGTGSFWMMAGVAFLGMNLRQATGATKLLNGTSNLASLAYFLSQGKVVWALGLLMATGQLCGAYLGSHWVLSKNLTWLRQAFLVTVGLILLVWFGRSLM